MKNFNLLEFSQRLKEIAKSEFGGIVKLGKEAGIPNILLYTQKRPREPKATVLYKLSTVGVDVNYLLTGKKGFTSEEFNAEILKLKARIFDLMEQMGEMKENIRQ